MEIERSEIQFVDTKDAFLHMTIFVSIKTIYSLRISCKKVNQWLSDPNSVSWKLRIQNTFPHSYEDVLKQTMDDQIQKLLKFDSLIEEGHSVSCYNLIQLSQAPSDSHKKDSGLNHATLPWQKKIFIEPRYAGLRIEGTKRFLDREMILNYDQTFLPLALRGDYVLFKNGSGKYRLHSISTNSVVLELNMFSDGDSIEVFSDLKPLVYILCRNDKGRLSLKEINFLTQKSINLPVSTSAQDGYGVLEMHLIENDRERYLKILNRSYDFGVKVYDVQKQTLIFNYYSSQSNEYDRDFWESLKYNSELRYYCTSHKGEITIEKVKRAFYGQSRAEKVFSRRFEQSVIQNHTIKWLTNDILTLCVQSLVGTNEIRCIFISATKREVIGYINGNVTMYNDGDNAFVYDSNTENVYSITFTTTYDQGTNLKSKLEEPDEQR